MRNGLAGGGWSWAAHRTARAPATGWVLNSELPGPILRREFPVNEPSQRLLEDLYAEGRLTFGLNEITFE